MPEDKLTKAFRQALAFDGIQPDSIEIDYRNGQFSTMVTIGEAEARSVILVPLGGEFSFEESILKPSIVQLLKKLPKPVADA